MHHNIVLFVALFSLWVFFPFNFISQPQKRQGRLVQYTRDEEVLNIAYTKAESIIKHACAPARRRIKLARSHETYAEKLSAAFDF